MIDVLEMGDEPIPVLDSVPGAVWFNGDGFHGRYLYVDEKKRYREELDGYVSEVFQLGNDIVSKYFRLGEILLAIDRRELYKLVHLKSIFFKDIYTFALRVFGFSQTTTSNVMNVVKRFGKEGKIMPEYSEYSYSKLVEFLPLTDEYIDCIPPEVPVRAIRELRRIWSAYGFDPQETWKEAMARGDEQDRLNAEREEKARKEKKKETGLLALLSGDSTVKIEEQPSAKEPIIIQPSKAPEKKKNKFNNDKARKEFFFPENMKKWDIYIQIPELGLTFYRYDFANGAYVLAEFSGHYVEDCYGNVTWYEMHRLHLITPDKPKYDMENYAVTYIIQYMTEHRDEI